MITEVLVIVSLITALIVLVKLAKTFKKMLKDRTRKELYDIIVREVYSEKELLEKKLEEQMHISMAEKKLLEKKLEEQISTCISNREHSDSINQSTSKQIKHLQNKILTLEKENEKYLKTIKSYLILSDLKISDLMNDHIIQDAAKRIRDRN